MPYQIIRVGFQKYTITYEDPETNRITVTTVITDKPFEEIKKQFNVK